MPSRLSPRTTPAPPSVEPPSSYNEDEVATLSGLPGPLVSELLPRQPGSTDRAYDRGAEVYTAESVLQARIAVCMLDHGVRYCYIRAAMRNPHSAADLDATLKVWRQYQKDGRRRRIEARSRRAWWRSKRLSASATRRRIERSAT
jgi:hypothetical protein